MRPGGSRYLVPAAALLVTFIAGGLLFFAVFALTDSDDEDVPFEAVTVTAAPPTATSVAQPPTASPTPAATLDACAVGERVAYREHPDPRADRHSHRSAGSDAATLGSRARKLRGQLACRRHNPRRPGCG